VARVPYNPVPDIQPQGGGESISVNTPPAAFGENIGNALQHLGSTVGDVGNELFSRAIAIQDLSNQTEARNKVIDFTTQAAQKQADFDSLQGIDAKNALPGHLKDIGDLRNSMRGTLGSPMAQRYFDQEASSFQNRVTFSSAAHAGDQFKAYAIGTAQAQVDLTKKAYADPFNEGEYEAKNQAIEDQSHTLVALQGKSEPERQAYVLKEQADNRRGQIEQQAMKDPIKAFGTLQTAIKNGEIDQTSADQAQNRIWVQNRGVGVENQAKGIFGDGKRPLADMDADAHKLAEDPSITLGDPLFEKDLKSSIRQKGAWDNSITRNQNLTNLTTLQEAIHSDKYHTMQELLADPDVGSAIHALPPKDQDKIPEMIKQHWAQHDADKEASTFTQLYGLAQHNPVKFLDMDLYDKDLPLARADRGVLLQMRKDLTKNPNADPQVQRSLSWMAKTHGQELSDLGVRWSPTRSADPQSDQVKNYNMYVGELAQAVQAFQQANGRPPSSGQEFEDKIAKPLLATQSTSQGTWFHGLLGNRNVPEFEKQIPDEVMTEAKGAIQEEALKNNLGAEYQPSENEIRMYIVRKQWDEFYKKSKGDGGTANQ
jgi:hypothetical protein